MAALLDKGTVEHDGDVAKSVLVPLHPATGALTLAQSVELASWLPLVAGSAYEATPEAMTHALTTASKASAPPWPIRALAINVTSKMDPPRTGK